MTKHSDALEKILNNRYHHEDCHIGYKHSDGRIEGCSCWLEDPITAIKAEYIRKDEVLKALPEELRSYRNDNTTTKGFTTGWNRCRQEILDTLGLK